MTARVVRRPRALRVHWIGPGRNPKFASPQCGAQSYQCSTTMAIVNCPKCLGRQDFAREALRGLDLTIGADLKKSPD